jgi:hypothetical protein
VVEDGREAKNQIGGKGHETHSDKDTRRNRLSTQPHTLNTTGGNHMKTIHEHDFLAAAINDYRFHRSGRTGRRRIAEHHLQMDGRRLGRGSDAVCAEPRKGIKRFSI